MQVKPNKLIDTKLSTPLFNLPLRRDREPRRADLAAAADAAPPPDLAAPVGSGGRAADGRGRLGRSTSASSRGYADFDRSTPLWYYILKEAELAVGGQHLGPVGGRIVAEVILGLLQADGGSYLNATHAWRPTLPAHGGAGDFGTIDFLAFAGVDPAGRGQ